MTTQRDSSTVRDRSTVVVSNRDSDNGVGIALAVIAIMAVIVLLWWLAFGPSNSGGGDNGGGGAVPSVTIPSTAPSVEPSPASS